MKLSNPTLVLRIIICIILFMHSVPGMLDGGVNNFGNLYLNPLGFGWLGLPLAWAIKLSHVATIFALLLDKWVKWLSYITIFILLIGIVLVHAPNGWFVVGGGTNGIEFNLLLMAGFITIMYPKGIKKITG